MMDKNIKFNYQTTKGIQLVGQKQHELPLTMMNNNQDMKKVVQNYEFSLDNVIAKGQNSQVYHGIDTNTQQAVAIKVIPILKNPTPKQRFELDNEISFCRHFAKHQNLVQIEKVLNTTNNQYIVMQRAQGDLKGMLMKKKVFGEEQVINFMLDVLEGLRHLHANGFMHCNVKPSNVLITSSGAKLTDFALCRKFSHESKIPIDSKEWTPYMNHLTLVTRNFDENNDAWALAVMTYECLHGYHNYPWKFENYSDLLQKIYSPSIQFNRKISKDMAQFLAKVLNPGNKLSIMDVCKEPFIKMCIQRRKQVNRRGKDFPQTNGTSPIRYMSQKFGNFSADLSDHVNRQYIRSNSNKEPLNQIQQLKKHTSHNDTSQSPRNFIEERFVDKRSLHPRQILDCQFSFMRFINIVIKQDENGHIAEKVDPKNMDPKYRQIFEKKDIDHKLFRFVLIKQMLSQKHCLKMTVQNLYHPENPFNIKGLEEYLGTYEGREVSRALKSKLKEYDEKYPTLERQMMETIDELNIRLKNIKPQWRSLDILTEDLSRKQIIPILGVRLSRQMCKIIWNQISAGYTMLADPANASDQYKKTHIISKMQQKARRVDFLISNYMLNCLLIDDFSDPQYFTKNSGLKIIMNNKPMKMELEHFKLIEQKLRSLEII